MSDLLKHPGESESNDISPAERAIAHTRRVFLFKLSLLLNGAVGVVLAVPIVGYLLAPAMKKNGTTGSWIKIGSIDDYPVGETRMADFVSPVTRLGDGETGKVACWVRRISARQFQVFAINCAHLGCPVRWFAPSKLFMCPCHGGAYYEDGSRASGPPERGLFEYRYQLVGNSIAIHAGDLPTLATEALCTGQTNPLVQLQQAPDQSGASSSHPRYPTWPA